MPGKEWAIPSDKKSKEILIVFLRAPESGRVKTRLAGDVGNQKALFLYKRFAAAVVAAADAWQAQSGPDSSLPAREVWLAYYPENKLDLMQDWLGHDRVFLSQAGSDLGRRMANAMAAGFGGGAGRCALVGTDIPELRERHLTTAFDSLEGADVVLGPSLDGGYWLIGACAETFSPGIFRDIDWGTETVFESTRARCRDAGLRWKALAALRDVDTLADLKAAERTLNEAGSKDRSSK